jgi:hypothetical protein
MAVSFEWGTSQFTIPLGGIKTNGCERLDLIPLTGIWRRNEGYPHPVYDQQVAHAVEEQR